MRGSHELGMDNAELQAYAGHLKELMNYWQTMKQRAIQVALANMKLNDGLGRNYGQL